MADDSLTDDEPRWAPDPAPPPPDLGASDEYDFVFDAELEKDGIADARKRAFLTLFSQTGHVSNSTKRLGLSRFMPTYWRNSDEVFAKWYVVARDLGKIVLEEEIRRRAFEGVIKPIYQKGVRVGSVREYSDGLAAMMIKQLDPTYKEQIQLTVGADTSLATALSNARKRLRGET